MDTHRHPIIFEYCCQSGSFRNLTCVDVVYVNEGDVPLKTKNAKAAITYNSR